jgi:cytochrome b561
MVILKEIPMARPQSYTKIAILLHWLIALMIIVQLAVGLVMGEEDLWEPMVRGQLYAFHKATGMMVIVLTLIRILWRVLNPPPALPDGMKNWEIFAVKATHGLFYILLLAIPLSGWALVTAAGRGPVDIFGIFGWPDMPILSALETKGNYREQISEIHKYLAYGMIGLLALHIGAALKHHFINKDTVLVRMIPFLKKCCGECKTDQK